MSETTPGGRRPRLSNGSARGVVLAGAGTVLVVAVLYQLGPAKVASGQPGPAVANGPAVPVTSTTVVATVSTTPTTAAGHDPSTVTVQVANGTTSSAPHAAGSLSSKLTTQGWKLLSPMDTTATTTSSVYYAPGYSTDAVAVAQAAGMSGAAIRPMSASPVTTSADLLVVIGSDQSGNSSG